MLYYKQGVQIPVWEITDKKGRKLYYERMHREGYRPVGCVSSTIQPDGGMVNVVESVGRLGTRPDGRKREIFVLKEADGFEAQASWYERLDGTKAQPTIPDIPEVEVEGKGRGVKKEESSDTESMEDYGSDMEGYF
jgi:hypothetical protein